MVPPAAPVIHGSRGTAVILVQVPDLPWITGLGTPVLLAAAAAAAAPVLS